MMSRLTIRNTGWSRLRTAALLVLLTAVMLISAAPSAALAQQAPGHVGSVSVTRADGSLTASWNAPAGATKYHVTYTSDHKKSWQLAALNHASTSITISGVDNKKVYYVAARAGNANGWGPWRDSAPAAPYKPPTDPVDPLDPPTSVTLTRADGTITATWPAVSEATSYHVGYSVDLGLTWYRNRVFYTKTSLTFKADNSLTYIVSVMSVDGDEQSEWRESAPIAPYVPPVGRPASVTVTRVDGILRVSWDAASGATHYHITYTSDHKKSWSLSSLNHKSTSISIAGVDNAKTYYVAVRGRSGNTFGAWRDSAAAGPFGPTPTPAPTPTATPLAPPANLAVAPGSGYLDITWDASTGATGYDVRVKPENASDWTTVASNITGTSYNYTTTQTIDWVGVRARNSGGTSAWTDISRLPSNDLMATYTGASIQSASAASASAGASGASAESNDVSAQAKLAAPTFTKTQRSINRFNAEINLNWNSVDFAGGYNLACTDTDGWAWHACGWDNSGTLKYSSVASTDTRPVKVTHYRRKAGEGTHTPGDYALIMGRHYEVAVRAVNANPDDASDWTNSGNLNPIFFWLYDFTSTRTAGQIALSWTPNLFATGYEIDCATYDPNASYSPTYTRCDTLTNQDDTDATHTATITTWTANSKNYSIDNTKHYDIRICSTHANGRACFLAPIIDPYVPPSLTASSVTTTTATLTLLGHTGNWYLKKIAPTAGTCSSAITGTTHNLTTLTAGTWHTYKAYSDSNCSSANEIAAEVFSTTMTTSSMDANSGSTVWIGRQFSSTQAGAQAFTTGPNSGGYTLASITGSFAQSIGTPGDIAVKLYNASGANPGTELATLSGDNPTAAGQYAYTCSGSGCALAASTTYFLVVNTPNVPATGSHRYLWNITASDSETNVPTGNGWSVANDGLYSPTSNLSSWSSSGGTYQIKVAALPKPSLTASSVAGTTATVTLTGHVGDWWLKKTAPTPAGTCTAGESDFSHALSSLTAGTWHTYKAYSDSNCSSANEIAAEVFTTATTVSSYDTTSTSYTSVGSYTGTLWQTGQAFTTGSNESGYTLSSIAGRFDAVSGTPGDIVVKLHAASGTNPGTALATLSGDNPTTAGTFTYTCSGNGCALAANTTYLVVMSAPDATASDRYYWLSTPNDTETLAPSSNGWSIENAAVAKSDSNAWSVLAGGSAAQIKVTALPKPGLNLTGVSFNGTTATVTLTGHLGDWWLKQTSPTPAGACTAGESDYSHALSSLTAGTAYTYKAYSDSGCSTANEIGSATFTPSSGVPTNVSVANSLNNGVNRVYPVSWNKPANTQATDSFAYELQCTNQGNKNTTIWNSCGTHNISETANTSMSQNVQHGVTGGLFYYVRVRTVKGSESSAWVIQKTQYGS